MKVISTKSNLQRASLLSEKIPNKNPTLPILNSVLISAAKNVLVFLSTNLEMALKVSIPSKIEKEGKVALPSKLFSSLISSLSDNEEIKLSSVNNNLLVTTSSSSTTIKGYQVDDFPILPEVKEKKSFNMSIDDFLLGLKSVYYSTSTSEMKPEINSVYLYSSKNTPLTFVGTDSFRLSEKIIHYNFSDFPNILIPYRSAVEILRIFENQDGELALKMNDNNLVLSTKDIEFTSRLMEGTYPDYKQIIPNKFTNNVTVNKKKLSDALKTAIMFCGKLSEIKIKIYEGENFIEILTNNHDLGEHTVNIKCSVDGEDLTMVFNYRYLLDCLTSINSEDVVLKFSGEGKPLLITSLDDTSFRYLIMPMKNI
ncbi:DNA polymerase III subunit beta [Patescibacteria group bacterium]